jgi:cellulose synthase/poly-beta-1,6-N-acetylglucosamine synthase-like glycosyltransferase
MSGRALVLSAYFGVLAVLAAYGLHRWWLLWLLARHRRPGAAPPAPADLPRLTVQLPVYNEMYVVERLIDAVAALAWPRDRFEVQVLDDSTDETSALAAARVAAWRLRGVDVSHVRRPGRAGFKAGALAHGLATARGELIAIFDADFVPPPDFALRLAGHFADPKVGMVQARWGHLNASHSALTRVQAMLLDGHFAIEHAARHAAGRFFNFNGTAGIWRRACIEDAGGWQHDTLTEDLDLSYRAQMRGWRFVFAADEVAPAELPIEMTAFKSQQHRWAKGSIQTARKLLPELLRRPLPAAVKLEAVVHLTANVGYVLTLALALLVVPAVWLRAGASPWTIAAIDLPLFALSSASIVRFYVVAQRLPGGSGRRALAWVPFLMAVGIGLCVNNARAVWEGLFAAPSDFRRTPKYGQPASRRRYRLAPGRDTWIEAALALYFTAALAASALHGLWAALPFLALFQAGFAYAALSAVSEGRRGGAS